MNGCKSCNGLIVFIFLLLVLLTGSLVATRAAPELLMSSITDIAVASGNGASGRLPRSMVFGASLASADASALVTAEDTATGPHLLRSGDQAAMQGTPGALVVVAGRYRLDDPLQTNIHNVTNAAYNLFRTHGYPPERVFYLATDMTLDGDGDQVPDVDALPSVANLEYAATDWAVDKVGPDRFLTIYLMGHGTYDTFYLDRVDSQSLTPGELDGWLDLLEAAVPGAQVNVIIDAAHSGSFIDLDETVSGLGRVIIASTSAYAVAYASQNGAIFSDHFIAALDQDMSLHASIEEARSAVEQAHPDQTPWLDSDGDGVPNEAEDEQEPAQRFLFGGSGTAITDVRIDGPTTGFPSTVYTFTATVNLSTITPRPYAPILNPISNPDGDGNYAVSWSYNHSDIPADSYTLQESGDAGFTSPVDFSTGDTSYQAIDKPDGTYYYRVRGHNEYGPGAWSNVESVTVGTARLGYYGDLGWDRFGAAAAMPLGDEMVSNPMVASVITTTQPITYIWQATDQPPIAHIASLSYTDTVTYTWDIPGPKWITVSATNAISTASTTHVITITGLPQAGDIYEPDDTCVQANAIPVSGTIQIHSFHDEGDEDWVAFEATSGITYVVEVRVPSTSTADVALEIYNVCDTGTTAAGSDPTFSPDIRLTFQPPADGTYYLKLSNNPTTTYGSDVVYHLSVRALDDNRPSGAVILVAGRLKPDDELQANIHNVTNRVYEFALAHGCTTDDIRYLATEAMTGVVGSPTKANLEDAITNWAAGRVGPDQPLTVYLMDHGVHDLLYLDKPSGEWITPADLDGWLDSLGTEVPVNVVVEACYSGSFIDLEQTVSGPGRVVIASTSNAAVAYATQEGATFSDVFLESLRQGTSLHSAFEEGNWAARQGHSDQQPWLDDDGDGIANEAEDGEAAALRSLACQTLAPAENWPPYIMAVEVGELSDGTGEIRAQVQDDGEVTEVRTVIYPPPYGAPTSGEEMIEEPAPLILEEHPTEEAWYTGVYTGFDEAGEYRLVVYAEDNEAAQSRPKEMVVRIAWPVYLPLVLRNS